jgi:uncharacterized protein (DUF608 family)
MKEIRKNGERLVEDIDEFLRLVVASHLIQKQQLDRLMHEFRNGNRLASWFGDTITGVAAFLVSRGVLTCWQVDKLRFGQYKGFFELDGYCLLDCLKYLETTTRYLARRKDDLVPVVIEVWPGPGKVEHRVVEVLQPPASGG